jgi:hypothetical protein
MKMAIVIGTCFFVLIVIVVVKLLAKDREE